MEEVLSSNDIKFIISWIEDKERHCGVICHCRYRTRDVQWRILAFNQKFDASERKINSCCRTQYKTQCKMHFTLFFTIDNNLPSRRQWGCLCITEKDLKDRKVVVNKKFYLKTTLKAWHFLTNLYSLWLCIFYANLINWHHGWRVYKAKCCVQLSWTMSGGMDRESILREVSNKLLESVWSGCSQRELSPISPTPTHFTPNHSSGRGSVWVVCGKTRT